MRILISLFVMTYMDCFIYCITEIINISNRVIRIIKCCCEVISLFLTLYLLNISIGALFTFPLNPITWAKKYSPYFTTYMVCWIMSELPTEKFFRFFHSFDEMFLVMMVCVYLLKGHV